jgi:hypothetical protein
VDRIESREHGFASRFADRSGQGAYKTAGESKKQGWINIGLWGIR